MQVGLKESEIQECKVLIEKMKEQITAFKEKESELNKQIETVLKDKIQI